MRAILILTLLFLDLGQARQGFGPGEQDWGYVTVREEAHMFWWLYFTTANVDTYTDRPLVLWLQGGPGVSSTGYGNFAELGPLDLDLNERNYTWVKDVNVLFVDNPVGTGFSYVEDVSALTTTNRQIATDFLELLKGFYANHPEFISVPLYILSESYGGKMVIEIALVIDQAIKDGNIESNFIGVGLGDAAIDIVNNALEYAPYLLAFGAVDQKGHDVIAEAAQIAKELYNSGRYMDAQHQVVYTISIIKNYTENMDIYNILAPIASNRVPNIQYMHMATPVAKSQEFDEQQKKVAVRMSQVKQALGLRVTGFPMNNSVYYFLQEDIIKPVTNIVEEVLNTTDIKVAVYNGQLDLIICTPGVVKWVDNLQWSGSEEWAEAKRPAISVNGIYEGFEKVVGNLALYWVNRSGHMVPYENPAAMDYILRKLTQDYDGTAKRNDL